MKIDFRFHMSAKQFEDLFIPYPVAYGCGDMKLGALYGRFVRHPDGKPTLEISNGFEVLPWTIDVPTGCKNLVAFKNKVKEMITDLVTTNDGFRSSFYQEEKTKQMQECLANVMEMMRKSKAGYAFLYYNPQAKEGQYSDFQIGYHKIRENDEYVEVRNKHLDLIHMINVTGTSVLCAMAQLLDYIKDNY